MTQPRSIDGMFPPHDEHAEALICGMCMIDESAFLRIADVLTPDDMFDRKHVEIMKALFALSAAGKPMDLVSVRTELDAQNVLHLAGGAKYLAHLAADLPFVTKLEHHAQEVAEHAINRRMIVVMQQKIAEAYTGLPMPAPAWRDLALAELNAVAQAGARTRTVSTHDAAPEVVTKLAGREKGKITGISTGFHEVDRMTAGLRDKEVYLVGGLTGAGKSSFAHSLAMNVASRPEIFTEETIWGPTPEQPEGRVERVEQRRPRGVAIFSLDSMDAFEITFRMGCAYSRVDSRRINNGEAEGREFTRLFEGLEVVSNLPIEIDDDTQLTPMRMRGKLRAIDAAFSRAGVKLSLAIVDYIQLMRFDGDPGKLNTEQRLNEIGKMLQRTAELFKIPLVVLTQLNKEENPRDCEALTMHAQNFWIVEWSDSTKKTMVPGVGQPPLDARVMVKKGRNGATGPCPTFFHRKYTLYSDESQ